MFSSGELILIALVALIVIGPERLPRVARMAGHLLGRLQRYVGDVKADINREMQLDELKKAQQDMVQSVQSMESSVTQELSAVESSLNNAILPPSEPAAAPAEPPQAPTVAADAADAADAPQLELGLESQPAASKKTA